jgi:hypothetical protein
MGCCGNTMPKELYKQTEEDILVQPLNVAAHKYKGTKSGRDYGRINSSRVLYIDPADYKPNLFKKIEKWEGTDPVVRRGPNPLEPIPASKQAAIERQARSIAKAEELAKRTAARDTLGISDAARKAAEYLRNGETIPQGEPSAPSNSQQVGRIPANYELSAEGLDLSDPTEVDRLIRKLGTRAWTGDGRYVANGYDIEQNAAELAEFVAWLYQNYEFTDADRAPRLLQIGVGESAGLARFFSLLGWQVVTVAPTEPKLDQPITAWEHVAAKSTAVDDTGPLEGEFDVVFIDGDTDVRSKDWERFLERASVVAVHDVAQDGAHPQVAEWWNGLSKGPKGGFKKGYREFVAEPEAGAKAFGIGVFTHE